MRTFISFPGLGIKEFSVSRIAIDIGGKITIAWYGLIIVIGMILAVSYVAWRAKRQNQSIDHVLDLAIALIVSGVVGARLYYVLTSLDSGNYKNFIDIINIKNGGLGIYGGILAGLLALIITARIKKLNFFQYADMIAPAVLLAQSIGRWGNFFNGEAHGYETTLPWRMGLGDGLFYHPTFLYESLWTLIGFLLAHFLFKYRRYNGQIMLSCFAWYGFGRMFIELLRSDSLYICSYHAWFTKISVIVGFACFVICSSLLIYYAIKKRRDTMLDIK